MPPHPAAYDVSFLCLGRRARPQRRRVPGRTSSRFQPHPPVRRGQRGAVLQRGGGARGLPRSSPGPGRGFLLSACAAGPLAPFARRPAGLVWSEGRERGDSHPFTGVRLGFGSWSPGIVRFTPGSGKTNQNIHIIALYLSFLRSECFVDRCYVPTGRKCYSPWFLQTWRRNRNRI